MILQAAAALLLLLAASTTPPATNGDAPVQELRSRVDRAIQVLSDPADRIVIDGRVRQSIQRDHDQHRQNRSTDDQQ